MAKKVTGTPNRGAAIERGKLLAKLRRMKSSVPGDKSLTSVDIRIGYIFALKDIAAWVKESAARASKVKGGLGRK